MADPHWASVVLLAANDNAAHGSTTFVDQTGRHTLTYDGGASYSTAQAAPGMTSSVYSDAVTSAVIAPDSADWDMTGGDYTIEFMVRWWSFMNQCILLSQCDFAGDGGLTFGHFPSDTITFQQNAGGGTLPVTASSVGFVADTWYHVAAVRHGATTYLYVNGVMKGSSSNNPAANNHGASFRFLKGGQSGYCLDGWMSNVRVTKGVARYPSGTTFTVPTLPFSTTAAVAHATSGVLVGAGTQLVGAAARVAGAPTRYWVGGTGNWSDNTNHWSASSGGAPGASLPTSSDNVIFDSASNATAYTVSIDSSPCNCRDFTANAPASGKVTFNSFGQVAVYGSLSMAGGSAGITCSGFITWSYKATSTGKTINWNGVTAAHASDFNGVGGEWTLTSTYRPSNSLSLTNGTLITNGFGIAVSLFDSINSGTRTLDMSGSQISVNGQFGVSSSLTLVVNTSSSVLMANGPLSNFYGGGKTYNDLLCTTGSDNIISITGANTFRNVTFSSAAVHAVLSDNQTITGTFSNTSISISNRNRVSSDTLGTARTITAAAVSFTDVDFQDITGAGAAASFTGTRLGNRLGNSNITFAGAATKYWVANAGSWTDATNHWATSSGGSPGATNYPLPQDSVVFDANSFSANGHTVTINALYPRYAVASFTTTGVDQTYTLAFSSGSLIVYGSAFTLDPNATITSHATDGYISFEGRTTQTLTPSAVPMKSIAIDSPGGTLTLGGSVTVVGDVALTRGTLQLAHRSLLAKSFSSSNTNTRSIGASGGGDISLDGLDTSVLPCSDLTNLTLADPLMIYLTGAGTGGQTRLVNWGNSSGGNEARAASIMVTTGSDTITAQGTFFKSLTFLAGFTGTFSNGAPTVYGNYTLSSGMTLVAGSNATSFRASSGTQTIDTNGKTMDFPVTFNGAGGTFELAEAMTVGSTRTTTLTAGTLRLNGQTLTTGFFSSSNANARNITASSGNITLTGNAGNVWFINNATNFTLTGALQVNATYSGSTSSRTFSHGVSSASDAISVAVSAGSDSVSFPGGLFGSLNFTGFSGTMLTTFALPTLAGSLTFSSGMTLGANNGSPLLFAATSGTHTLTFNGKTPDWPITFAGPGGTWQLGGDIAIGSTRTTTLSNGTLVLNGNDLTTGRFNSSGTSARAITFTSGSRLVVADTTAATVFDCGTSTNLTVTRSGGTIELSGNTGNVRTFAGGGKVWPTVDLSVAAAYPGGGYLNITGSNTFKSFAASNGGIFNIRFTAGTTTTLEDDNSFPTAGGGSIGSITASNHTLTKSTGTVAVSNYSISRSTATGGAAWEAFTTNGNTDSGNNSGWTFTSSVTHATSGALVGAGADLDGTAARTRQHASTGLLAGSGSAITGAATSYTIHLSSGVLLGAGAALAGAAARTRQHLTTGVLAGSGAALTGTASSKTLRTSTGILVGPGAVVAGVSARTRQHAASGVLLGSGSTIAGQAFHGDMHGVSGAIVGPGATVTGAAARTRVHVSTGALTGSASVLSGTAAHKRLHQSSGVLAGTSSVIAGAAARTRQHGSTGLLIGPGSAILGASARSGPSAVTHTATGVLVGPSANVTGTAARTRRHASTGVVRGAGSALAGTAVHGKKHPATGVVRGQGSVIAGTAVHRKLHASSGVLRGQGSDLDGAAQHQLEPTHPSTGTIRGAGSIVAGIAVHRRPHAASGALSGGSAILTASAVHIGKHTASGALSGPGTIIIGTAAVVRTHLATGALIGRGSVLTGQARGPRLGYAGAPIGPEPVQRTRLRAGGRLVGTGSQLQGEAQIVRTGQNPLALTLIN